MVQTKEIKPPRTTQGIPVYMSMAQFCKYIPEDNQVFITKDNEVKGNEGSWQVQIALDRTVCRCHDIEDAIRIAKVYKKAKAEASTVLSSELLEAFKELVNAMRELPLRTKTSRDVYHKARKLIQKLESDEGKP